MQSRRCRVSRWRFSAGFCLAMVLIAFFLSTPNASGATLHVDTAGTCGGQTPCYATIQAGINAASAGDTVQVAAGTYNENINLKSGVVLQGAGTATTIIHGTGTGSVVTASGVGPDTKIDGFTITGGAAYIGGGFYSFSSSPTISNMTISGNSASFGGGIYMTSSSPTISNTTISGNTATDDGGGIMSDYLASPTINNVTISGNTADLGGGISTYNSSPTISNMTISGNTARFGGGICNRASSSPTISNTTISGNTAIGDGGGMYNYAPSSPTISNTIITANFGGGIYNNAGSVTSDYNDVWNNSGYDYSGVSAGAHDISADPKFIDAANGNFRLSSDSPCIDAGSNAAVPSSLTTDFYGYPRIVDGNGDGIATVDMGATEFQPSGVGTATHFAISAPAAAAASEAFNVTVTAKDNGNFTITNYTGTVHFTSSDGNAILPADAALTNGVGTFSATLRTAGSQTITATDTATPSISGSTSPIAVAPGAATRFSVSAPSSATAASAFSFTVTARDTSDNTATAYTGTVHFTSSDTNAVLPADVTLTNGVGSFSATLKTAGTQTITATDTANPAITGASGDIAVSPGEAARFSVSAPASATADTAFSFTVTAQDENNNTITDYSGTVHFTSSDTKGVFPADATLTNGAGTFTALLKTAGSQTLTATDTANESITGASTAIDVIPGNATKFSVSAPSTATAGSAFSVTVTALDAENNTATGYTGTVHFTSSDAAAALPADTTLTNGVGSFSATLKTAGSRIVTATDSVTLSITGTSGPIAVKAGAATHFSLSAPPSATAGETFEFTVTALDANNNVMTEYAGTVHITSSDANAILPADTTLNNGAGTFSAALKTAGSQTITATDTVNASINGASGAIAVNAAAATHLTVSAPASAASGNPFTFTIMSKDAYNNTATGYSGTVHFTSTDTAAVLPADATLTNGVGTFTATLKTAGTQSITATDTANTSLTGTSGAITVISVPDLIISKSHYGNLRQGQPAIYTITVKNSGTAPTTGTVTVTDTLPDGLTARSIRGSGWVCSGNTLTCTHSNVLMAGGSYPPIILNVSVAADAPATVANTAIVSGGGEVNTGNNTSTDVAAIIQAIPDLTIIKSHSGNFRQGQRGATYRIRVTNSGTGPTAGTVTVKDLLPEGLTARAISGAGWSCSLDTLTCTRSNTLQAGSSYPPINLSVNVTSTAPATVTNTAIVSGSGEINADNNTASDVTRILQR